jgi:DNA polymerase V
MLSEIVGKEGRQIDLFQSAARSSKSGRLMIVLDQINAMMGRQSLKLASEGFRQPWKMKQGNKSPNYTTDWKQLVEIV